MKAACYATTLLATIGVFAYAQNAAPAASPTLVLPVGGTGGSNDQYPYSWHASTLQEGWRRGIADVIRAEGDYNLNTSAAAVNYSQSRLQEIENQKKWTQAYFDIHNLNRQEFDAEQKRRRASPEDWIRFAQAGRPKRLQRQRVGHRDRRTPLADAVDGGGIPPPTRRAGKGICRSRVSRRSGAEAFLEVLQVTDDLLSGLKVRVHYLPAEKYVAAKRFLESLVFEAGQPAG